MASLMSENLRSAICEQIGHEKANANIYMHMCGFLKNKGLDNLAKHFDEQHDEETGHSKEFFNLLTDLNADVYIPEINEVNTQFKTMIELTTAYLDREILTTKSIDEIKKLAISENCPVVEEKMRDMITKQQKEYEEATLWVDNAELMPEWWQCAIWDKTIG
jgi:ferritin